MARKISISFKETTKDLELYDLLSNMEDKSCEIKRLLRKALEENSGTSKENNKIEKTDKKIDILDF
ncbi:circadian clock-controlled protein [Clostridium senegalense]